MERRERQEGNANSDCYWTVCVTEISLQWRARETVMAPSLYSSENSRTYISLQPLPSSQTTRQQDRHSTEEEEQLEEEEVGVDPEQDHHPARRQSRSNLRRAPSQANMHHTTVPQAITPSQLGSRKGKTVIVSLAGANNSQALPANTQ